MNFPENFPEKLQQYIDTSWFQKLADSLKIYEGQPPKEIRVEKIKTYIEKNLMGKFRGESSIRKFFQCLELYKTQSDFVRNDRGLVDYNTILPINSELKHSGLRSVNEFLGQDGFRYILKQSEALKGTTCALNSNIESLYNPNMAQAVFEFLGEPCAEHYPACERNTILLYTK